LSYLINPFMSFPVASESEWTPNLSGTAGEDGIATTHATAHTWKSIMTSGNVMIGSSLQSVEILWKAQSGSPIAGTWEIKHYDSGDSQKGSTTSTTATPTASFTSQVFDASNSGTIAENDYFTLRCLQTDDNARDFVFRTYATCSGDCQYSNSVLSAGYALNPVSSTWTYS
jgi:hypothetical protein